MSTPRPASDWPEDPYPGRWPDHSYVVGEDGVVHAVEVDAATPSGWAVRSGPVPVCLDAWLRERGLQGLAGRTAVLSFGSNRCPSKLLRQGGPWVNLACETSGLAAVWSHGTRAYDEQVVATLVGAQDHAAPFFVSLCTDEELALLDVVEGRGTGYDLVPIDPAQVVLADGSSPDAVSAYVGLRPHRWPVAGADGHPVLLDAMDQDEITRWREGERLHWEPVAGSPYLPLTADAFV
ncbi:hypothetical protein CLV56_2244 [Mumia flava]|uniref:Uncharacterized protein n=1 Tax=Mumia flava TaxID=1348852 RepID=A0A2M9BJ87_9ACTN|nr:hypothetical protein [Mumia flava]PJJ58001.1 hypothetical protein CLV56_2244 [Mumia flava]